MNNLIILFLVGVLEDFLFTLNVRFVSEGKAIPAAIFSFLTTAIGMLVLYNILVQLEAQRSILAIIVYALGIGVGAIVGMKVKTGSRD